MRSTMATGGPFPPEVPSGVRLADRPWAECRQDRQSGGALFERLTALDASFLYLDRGTTPLHVGALSIYARPSASMGVAEVRALVARRLAYVPRFRMRVRGVPWALGRPVWIPDPEFDLDAHIRLCTLARPGTHEQLVELTARILARPLDRNRPLWEIHVVEGLADGHLAIISKSHQVLVDGNGALDITQVLLDDVESDPLSPVPDPWVAVDPPTDWEILTSTLTDALTAPLVHPLDAARGAAQLVTSGVGRVGASMDGAGRWARHAFTAAVTMARAPVEASLQADVGPHRRYATVTIPLEAFQDVHRRTGSTVNDAILTVLAGALRSWLVGRGAAVDSASVIRALIPVSTRGQDGRGPAVSAFLVDLPVGEPDPLIRLRRVSHESAAFTDVARALGAPALVSIAGFGPATLHALGARLAAGMSSRFYNLAITNVPGPQRTMFAGRARLVASYPVMPLVSGQALAVGVTSYDGSVFLGMTGDRAAVADLADLAASVPAAVAELREAVGGSALSHYAQVGPGSRGEVTMRESR